MGAGKEMWIAAYETACEKFEDGDWGLEEFELEMKQLGYDPAEISDHVEALSRETQ